LAGSRKAPSVQAPNSLGGRARFGGDEDHETVRACEYVDVLIKDGWVVDGSGEKRFRGDVAVVGEWVVEVGEVTRAARRVIDAAGMIVAPGFIDAHVHSEIAVLSVAGQDASNRQGVTTHVVGQDGFGFAPTDPAAFEFMALYLSGLYGPSPPLSPGSVAEFLDAYRGQTSVNVATLLPHGVLRLLVGGDDDRPLRAEAFAGAARIIDEAMAQGALGLSTGLDYVPSLYASTEELVTLCRRVASAGGIYVSHIRYAIGTSAALEEAVSIGRQASIPLHVSHLYGDDDNDGRGSSALLSIIDAAVDEGLDVSFDAYPYTYGSTTLAILLPGWIIEHPWEAMKSRLCDGAARERLRGEVDLDRHRASEARIGGVLREEYQDLSGLDLTTAAARRGVHPVDLVCDLLVDHEMAVSLVWTPRREMWRDSTVSDDLAAVLRHPRHMLCSDGIYAGDWVHPRGFGAFARYVGRLPREGVLTLEQAVQHVTSTPARRFGFSTRGLLRPGSVADVVVFDPHTFVDRADDPWSRRCADGMKDVLVAGVPVLSEGVRTGALPGRGLRRRSEGGGVGYSPGITEGQGTSGRGRDDV
jgi:N-acyl-D-amino-acid deacylase